MQLAPGPRSFVCWVVLVIEAFRGARKGDARALLAWRARMSTNEVGSAKNILK